MVHNRGSILIKEYSCPLCLTTDNDFFHHDTREYYHCTNCSMVFVPPQYYLTAAEEKAVYDQHENSADDPGYRNFLGRIFKPLSQRLKPQSNGLDFGSGPGPTLSVMFTEAGHTMQIYDPFYAPDMSVLELNYDFITATEVVEHLHHPGEELDRLWSCLNPGGQLGIMTKRVTNQQAFSNWHYTNDPTHVCFFSIRTFQWLATHWSASLDVINNDVVLLTKSGPCLSCRAR
ncbi:MAG: class I SAM-dependent methyltransferase [Proteobacteria bacterium]|nr:class I SAM-dependent methyltransferase [Pseudomonadota bacterium]